jgi:hypothetical protein
MDAPWLPPSSVKTGRGTLIRKIINEARMVVIDFITERLYQDKRI